MRFKYIQSSILLIINILWIVGNLFLGSQLPLSIGFTNVFPSSTPTPNGTSTPTTATPSPDAYLSFVGVITAAIVGALIAGLFGIIFVIYQARKNRELSQENQAMQFRLNATQADQRFQEEIDKTRYSDWVIALREARERERQRKLAIREAAKETMVQARSATDREQAYRKALHADPNITQLQILDMTYPLEVTKVYVRLRLHPETHMSLEVDKELLQAEARHDPNALLQVGRSLLETRISEAMAPEKALKNYPRCLFLGDPGAGKSTLLKYLTLMSIDGKLPNLPAIPIHISLADFASSPGISLIEFAATRWDEWYGFPGEEARVFMETCLIDGHAIMLLDALDETVIGGNEQSGQESYHRVLEAIRQITSLYPTVPIVVTARKAGYFQRERLGWGFTEFEVLDFRSEDIKEFVNNWFAYHPMPRKYVTSVGLNDQLERNSRMLSLAANPLLLCLIIMVYELHQDLPEKQADLYKQCIDTLLFKWDTSRDIRRLRAFKTEHKRELLTEIAWHFHRQGKRYFEENELLVIISNFLPTIMPEYSPEQARLILQEIEEENGLLKEQAQGWHGFLHLTLQEYFVAQYAATRNKLNELLSHCGEAWWEEVFLLYAGCVSDASPLLRNLLLRERRNSFLRKSDNTSLLWAGQCLSTRPRVKKIVLREKIVDRLLKFLWKKEGVWEVDDVAKVLARIGGDRVKNDLIKMLINRQAAIKDRQIAAATIGFLKDQTVLSDLVAVLKDTHDDVGVRMAVAGALGSYKDQTVLSDLVAVLKDTHDDVGVREAAANTLGSYKDQTVLSDLVAVLKDTHDDVDLRQTVTQVLITYEPVDQTVLSELLAVLKDTHDDVGVRMAVAALLGGADDYYLIVDEAKIKLKRRYKRRYVGRRRLSFSTDQTVLSELLAVLKDTHDDVEVRKAVAGALGSYKDQTVLSDLVAVLKDTHDDVGVREAAVWTLGSYKDQTVLSELLAVLKDTHDDVGVRMAVARILGIYKDQTVLSDLVAVLKDTHDDVGVREAAVWTLGSNKDQTVLSELLAVLKDTHDDVEVRWRVYKVLLDSEKGYVAKTYSINILLALWISKLRRK
jgi:HEAT repeat protein